MPEGARETGDEVFSFLSKTLCLENILIKNTITALLFLPQYLLVLINFLIISIHSVSQWFN